MNAKIKAILLFLHKVKKNALFCSLVFEAIVKHILLKMKKVKHPVLLSVLLSVFLFSFVGFQQSTIPDGIILSIKNGNAKELAKYFNTSIELIILDKEGVYSKVQAEQILKEFFLKNTTSKFIKNHEGGKVTSKYCIGTLYANTGQYRLSFFLEKDAKGELVIINFRIEDDNN